ncbi:hypothetical protein [Limnohabitans sp.]|uniref:hypothetical protein n=1 Tax=Limnohabitans sp. TaxID=1907725 RepID=UPI00286F16F9|nr:hypothetical protein [Limnohabitans sp.]
MQENNIPSTTEYSPRFTLGKIIATRAVFEHLEGANIDASKYLKRHACGDWGDIPFEDKTENEFAVTRRLRLLSSYSVGGKRIWVITEADRSVTTLLFPHEY